MKWNVKTEGQDFSVTRLGQAFACSCLKTDCIHIQKVRAFVEARLAENHVVMVSSGVGSAVAWKKVVDKYGPDKVVGLFADVNGEDPDNYRFLLETYRWVNAPLVILDNGGKTIWDVFKEVRFLSNSRVDSCSRVLKREVMRAWLEDHRSPSNTTAHIGYDISEEHRIIKAKPHWLPWTADAPLCWDDPRPVWKDQAIKMMADAGIEPPWLTRNGYAHANCEGMCVKMGHKQAAKTLRERPHVYMKWERNEEEIRVFLGKDVAIMKDRRGSTAGVPLTLKSFRERLVEEGKIDHSPEWESCNCVSGWDEDDDFDKSMIVKSEVTGEDVVPYLEARMQASDDAPHATP